MTDKTKHGGLVQSRREFLATTGAIAATAAMGGPGIARAASKKGGTLRFATRVDGRGLDPHRNLYYYVSNPLAATSMGLVDLDTDMNLVPGIAESWEHSKDLMRWTFRLRKGVEYHNGRTVDAASVKWNFDRMMDPKTSYAYTRASFDDVDSVKVIDPLTVQVMLKIPSAAFASSVCYYPAQLMAPDSVEQADTHPIGCGPFKFVSWKRYAKTELVRFENYFETDAEGNQLPYLDAIEGYPKREDKVRLTALRTNEVDLIENMAYSDVADFKKKAAGNYNTWDIPQVGCSYFAVQMKEGPFALGAPNGKMMREALMHAIDKEAVHQAVFNGLSEKLTGFYTSSSPWHMEGIQNVKEYDPEKTKWILNKLNAMNTPIAVVSRQSYQYMRNSGEILHAMLVDAGFKATYEVFDNPVLRKKYDTPSEWGIDSSASSYRFEPNDWYGKHIHSKGSENRKRWGYKNEKVDKLIEQAKTTADKKLRLELYTEVESLLNADAGFIYSHGVPLTSAAHTRLKGYKPAFAGPYSTSGAGIRTAYIES